MDSSVKLVDLKIENIKLKAENQALKNKMAIMKLDQTSMKHSRNFDYDKYEALKQKCRGECFIYDSDDHYHSSDN
jgi:hypothetical protein